MRTALLDWKRSIQHVVPATKFQGVFCTSTHNTSFGAGADKKAGTAKAWDIKR